MFIDQAKIFVKGGDGGNGIVAFRREKYVPDGGPSGGDGGRGGDVVFVVDPGIRTLQDFRYQSHFKAGRGEHGMGKAMHGKNGAEMRVVVPPGTTVYDAETGAMVADLVEPGTVTVVAKGGRGGRGNPHFTSSVQRAPRVAEKGEPGVERWLRLELKLLADVGLVGMPNAGKSMLLAAVSEAKPKIADYPFTTIEPNLGVVAVGESQSFVLADIPGLIEGAHTGVGLGHAFLRHVERTKVLLHLVDASGMEGRDPLEDYATVSREIALYNPGLADRPKLVVLTKIDLPAAQDNLPRLTAALRAGGAEVLAISAATGEGVRELLYRAAAILATEEAKLALVDAAILPEKTYRSRTSGFSISAEDGIHVVKGEDIERIVAMTNMDNDEAVRRFQNILRKIGISDALKKEGLQEGDIVRIRDMEFEYTE